MSYEPTTQNKYAQSQIAYEAAAPIAGRSLTRSKAPGRLFPVGSGPLYAAYGEGSTIVDVDGNHYIDMLCALGAVSLGYNSYQPELNRFHDGVCSLPYLAEGRAASAVLKYVAPWATSARFVRTGSEATHAAYRIAKAETGRKYVLVGDWCYDNQTEVLTESGWKLFADIGVGERLATLDIDGDRLVFQPALEVNAQPYSGAMISFTGRGLDLFVSPNHRVLRAFPDQIGTVQWKFSRAEDLLAHKKRAVMRRHAGRWDGDDNQTIILPSARNIATRRGKGHPTKGVVSLDSLLFAELLGYFISEGFRLKRKRAAYEIVICQNKGPVYDRIAEVIRRLGFRPHLGARKVTFASKELWLWLEAVGDGAPRKHLPRQVMAWSSKRLRILLDAMVTGDGTVARNGHRTYYTSSKRLADNVQEIALRCGSAATIREVGQTRKQYIGGRRTKSVGTGSIYHVSLCERRVTTSVSRPRETIYEGMIYCARVPNGTLYVRRNGKPVWSGNSYHGWHEWASTDSDTAYRYAHGENFSGFGAFVDGPDGPIDAAREIAAVFVEPHRWATVDPEWLLSVRAWCQRVGALLIFDEMIYGGRWALGGASEYFGVVPDLACYGKAFGNGQAIAFVVGGGAVAEHGELVSGTYSGDAFALEMLVAVISTYIKNPVIERLWKRGRQLQRGLDELAKRAWPFGVVCREGAPVHQRLRFETEALGQTFAAQMAARGVLWHPACVNICYSHTPEQIESVIDATDESLNAMASSC